MKRPARSEPNRSRRLAGGMLLVACLLCLLSSGFGLLVSRVEADPGYLPVSLHSVLNADYSADPRQSNIQAVDVALIGSVIRDSTTVQPGQYATVVASLLTPVPFVTPAGGVLPTAFVPSPTLAPVQPTATQAAPATHTASPTPSATLAATRTLVSDPPTRTPVPIRPTDQPRPTDPPARPTDPPTAPPVPTDPPAPTSPPPTLPAYPPPYP